MLPLFHDNVVAASTPCKTRPGVLSTTITEPVDLEATLENSIQSSVTTKSARKPRSRAAGDPTKKRGRPSVATTVLDKLLDQSKSKLKSSIDVDENTNDMLYSEDNNGVVENNNETDEEARKESKSKPKTTVPALLMNPVTQKIPPGCSQQDYDLFKRVQEISANELKSNSLIKPKEAPVTAVPPSGVLVIPTKAGDKHKKISLNCVTAPATTQPTSGTLLIDSINQFQAASSRLPAYITFGNCRDSFTANI